MNGPSQKPFQGKINYDYLMWIDGGKVFTVDMFKQLLSHDVSIVSGVYLTRDLKHYDVCETIEHEYVVKNGVYNYMTREGLKLLHTQVNTPTASTTATTSEDNGLRKVDYCGMGFMLIKQGIVEKMRYPWFRPTMTTMTHEDGSVLRVEVNTEEQYFCQELRQLNIDQYVDINVVVGQENSIVL